jgi:hypothetical protein
MAELPAANENIPLMGIVTTRNALSLGMWKNHEDEVGPKISMV